VLSISKRLIITITWPRSAKREGAAFGEQSRLCYPSYIDPITLLHSNHKAWAAGQKCPLTLYPTFQHFLLFPIREIRWPIWEERSKNPFLISMFLSK